MAFNNLTWLNNLDMGSVVGARPSNRVKEPVIRVIASDGHYYAVDNNDNVICMDSPTACIQEAVNAAPVGGTVVVLGDVYVTQTVYIAKRVNLLIYGTVYINAPVTFLQLGTDSTYVEGLGYIYINKIDGIDQAQGKIGVKFHNASGTLLMFNEITNTYTGLYWDSTNASYGCGENRVFGGILRNNYIGIDSSTSTTWMEGNVIIASVFSSYIGIRTNGDFKFNIFIGVSDNSQVSGSTDIIDNSGYNLFLMYYFRPTSISSNITSMYVNLSASSTLQFGSAIVNHAFLMGLYNSILSANAYYRPEIGNWVYMQNGSALQLQISSKRNRALVNVAPSGSAGSTVTWSYNFQVPPVPVNTSVSLTIGTNGSYGPASTVSPPAQYLSWLAIKIVWGGTFGSGETVSVQITATYEDGTTASIVKSATAPGSLWLTYDDLLNLIANGKLITSLSFAASSNLSSTSATVTVYVIGA